MDTGKVPGEIGTIPELREVIGTHWEVYGPYWALVERREKKKRRGRPPKPNLNWEPPLSFFPPTSSFPLPLLIGKGGVLLPVGVGLPPRARHPLGQPLLLHSFLYGGGGHPIDTTIDLLIS